MDQPTHHLQIGTHQLATRCLVAPMAGVTDQPFRWLCKKLGAGYAVSEMVSADPRLRNTRKSRLRRQHDREPAPIAVQIAGADADFLAEAAQYNVAHGAQIIDINMGCPAKKVCKKAAGSALLGNEALVEKLLNAVTTAVEIPVTLKIRTGTDEDNINAVRIAKLAETAGIQMLTVHGRTRKQLYKGQAEYNTIAEVVSSVNIPVIANGDINSPQTAARVLQYTGAAGVMIGRAGQGNPWIYAQIDHYLNTGQELPLPDRSEIGETLLKHVKLLHEFYGEQQGLRVARKHIGWYLDTVAGSNQFKRTLMRIGCPNQQLHLISQWFADSAIPSAA